MERIKCTACGCEELEEFYFSCPTDDGYCNINRPMGGIIVSYKCKKCGHIELYYKEEKKEKQSPSNSYF